MTDVGGAVYYARLLNPSDTLVLEVEEALQRLLASMVPVTRTETVNISDGLGRILAEDIAAPVDLPPFDNSAMDGYAVNSCDAVFQGEPPYQLRVVATSFAGKPWTGTLSQGAVRIFTGAAMPRGADAVIVQEEVTRSGDMVTFNTPPAPADHVRPVGDDIKAGAALFSGGDALRAFEIGWAAACGIEALEVFARPRIGIFATGDELREPGATLAYGQIHESNRLMLRSLSAYLPVELNDLGILADDPAVLQSALDEAAEAHDMLITSGGVSVGESDFVREVVEALGAIEFWRVAIKPGKPFATGRIGRCVFMGLPGNPASAVVTFLLFVAPAITKLCGGAARLPFEVDAMLSAPIMASRARTEYQRGRYWRDSHGLHVAPTSNQGSNRIGSFRDANCLLKVDPGSGVCDSGSLVRILPFDGLLSAA